MGTAITVVADSTVLVVDPNTEELSLEVKASADRAAAGVIMMLALLVADESDDRSDDVLIDDTGLAGSDSVMITVDVKVGPATIETAGRASVDDLMGTAIIGVEVTVEDCVDGEIAV